MFERKRYILYVVIFSAVNSRVYSSTLKATLIYINNTWNEAAEHCLAQYPNGHLASQSDIMLLQNRGSIPDSLSVWVADNVVLTPWMKIIGCFEETTVTQFTRSHLILDNNRPGLCKLWCTSFSYFAVKGSSCYCLNDSFVGNATGTDQCSECLTSAYDTSVNEYCGGTTAVNVYQRDSYVIDESLCNIQADTGCNCLVAECTAAQQVYTYYNRICSSNQPALCGNGDTAMGPDGTWSNRISRCLTSSSSYLEAKEDNLRSYICQPSITSQYWIGVYRTRTRVNFTADMNPVTCGRCIFLNGSCEVIDSPDCTDLYPFVCKFNEIEAITTPGTIFRNATEETTNDGEGGTSIGIIIAPVIVIVVIIGAVVLFIIIRKHRRKSSGQDQDCATKTQDHHQCIPPTRMIPDADEEEEEHEYDVTNRTGRKQSDGENNYDHMFSAMNNDGVYNSLNRGGTNLITDTSDNVYDHAIKPDNNYYDVADRRHHVQVVVTADNTYDATDIR